MASPLFGRVKGGKDKAKRTLLINGELTPAQWAEFKERLTRLARHFNLTVKPLRAKKKKASKKK